MTRGRPIVVGEVMLAAGSLGALAAGWEIVGGMLILAAAVVLPAASRARAPVDSVGTVGAALAAFTTVALAAGGAAVYAIRFESRPHPEVAGAGALAAIAVAGYMDARARASLGEKRACRVRAGERLALLAHRSVLLVVLGTGSLAGAPQLALWACAALAAVSVAGRLLALRLRVRRPPSGARRPAA